MLNYNPYDVIAELRAPGATLTVESDDFTHNQPIPDWAWGADAHNGGRDRSPSLRWSGAPEGTKSFAVTVFDPDAPTASGFWHWVTFNIPATVTELPADAGSADHGALPDGTITLRNDGNVPHYIGSAPPKGTGTHRYFYVVDALDVETLDIDPSEPPASLGLARFDHTIARGILIGTATP